jgi:hypothetical protein
MQKQQKTRNPFSVADRNQVVFVGFLNHELVNLFNKQAECQRKHHLQLLWGGVVL